MPGLLNALDADGLHKEAVMSTDHAHEHGDRQHRVSARCHERRRFGAGNLLGSGLDYAEDFFLVRPDQDPDIEQHDGAHPRADTND